MGGGGGAEAPQPLPLRGPWMNRDSWRSMQKDSTSHNIVACCWGVFGQQSCARLLGHKSLTGFKVYATSANKRQHCCGSMQTDSTCWAQHFFLIYLLMLHYRKLMILVINGFFFIVYLIVVGLHVKTRKRKESKSYLQAVYIVKYKN